MGTQGTLIQINRIFFEDKDQNAMVYGKVNTGYLNYHTELEITMTQLNQILSHLQYLNPQTDLYEHISCTPINELESFIEADFSALIHNELPIHLLEDRFSIKEIRA